MAGRLYAGAGKRASGWNARRGGGLKERKDRIMADIDYPDQAPDELPPGKTPPEAPQQEPPGVAPAQPDIDQPDTAPVEMPPPD